MKFKPVLRPLLVALCAATLTASVFAAEKWATASSWLPKNPPEAVMDKTKGERWRAKDGTLPQWWQADLGSEREVSGLTLDWWFSKGTYKFKVEGSADKTEWKVLADKTTDGMVGDGPVEITKTSARYLKITITDASRPQGAKPWASLKTVQIKVTENGKETEWKPGG